MATKSENAEIAVLQTQMVEHAALLQEVRGDVKEIKTTLIDYTQVFVPRKEFEAFKKQYWLGHTVTALLSAAMAGLLFWFFNSGVH